MMITLLQACRDRGINKQDWDYLRLRLTQKIDAGGDGVVERIASVNSRGTVYVDDAAIGDGDYLQTLLRERDSRPMTPLLSPLKPLHVLSTPPGALIGGRSPRERAAIALAEACCSQLGPLLKRIAEAYSYAPEIEELPEIEIPDDAKDEVKTQCGKIRDICEGLAVQVDDDTHSDRDAVDETLDAIQNAVEDALARLKQTYDEKIEAYKNEVEAFRAHYVEADLSGAERVEEALLEYEIRRYDDGIADTTVEADGRF